MNTRLKAIAFFVLLLLPLGAEAEPWARQSLKRGAWSDAGTFTADAEGIVTFRRSDLPVQRLARSFQVDVSETPVVEVVTYGSTAQWRLTGQIAGKPELVLADFQFAGTCRRNLSERLGCVGNQTVTLRFYLWGWSGGDPHYLRFSVRFVHKQAESDADALTGAVWAWDANLRRKAEKIRSRTREHPRLRFRAADRPTLIKRASSTHRAFVEAILNTDRDEKPYTLTAETWRVKRPAWGAHLLSIRPPHPPNILEGEGSDPFPGKTDAWRELCWHDFSYWLIGAAVAEQPAPFIDQARRWTLALTRWRFWLEPKYIYFDFDASYPLQCLCFGYDVAFNSMNDAEQVEVREAIASIARGLYLNALTGHGSIYNDLRGNHTAVTFCGLGIAGLTLLGEHPEAPCWVALAEQFMLDTFEEHTSGGWTESPSYGAYGVNEWLKLAEMLGNVTGRDHVQHPFLHRFGEYQLFIADWEGRDLAYNGGGGGAFWNHWVFHLIAREFRDSRFQWLANFMHEDEPGGLGYGDLFWWYDSTLKPRQPAERNVGRCFADIGLSVWRSGWEADATILLHHCGRKGQHKERNMNHVTLYSRRARLLPDNIGGRTENHNVPMVDGNPQNLWHAGETLAFHSDEVGGYSLGKWYGQTRHVLYLRPDLVVLVDDLPLRTDRDQTVTLLLHPNGDTTLHGHTARTINGEAALLASCFLPDGKPLPLKVAPLPEPRRATHLVQAMHSARKHVRIVTVLALTDATAAPHEVGISPRENALDIFVGSVHYRLGLGPGVVADGFAAESDLWIARLEGGKPSLLYAVMAPQFGRSLVRLRVPGGVVQGGCGVSWRSAD